MNNAFTFKELNVWHRAVDFADKSIALIDEIDSNRKHFRLFEQLESAVTSISLNIAEGKGRYSKKEYIHFCTLLVGQYMRLLLCSIFSKKENG